MLGAAGGGVAFVLDGRLCEVASYADESMDVPREAEHKPSMAFVPMRKALGPDACAAGEAAARALDYDDVTTEVRAWPNDRPIPISKSGPCSQF